MTGYTRPDTMGGTFRWADTPRTRRHFTGDIEALRRDLSERLRGEIRFDSQSRALYATDASNYRQAPLGVAIPRDSDDLIEAVRTCAEHGASITHRGGGTSLAGQTTNDAVIIDTSKYVNRVLEIDEDARLARVEPGALRDALNDAAAEHGLMFGPDTSTHRWATLGGMIGNNAAGMHSEVAGKTVENVEEMVIMLYDGTQMRVGPTSEDKIDMIIRGGGRRSDVYRDLRDLRDRYADLIRERYPDIPRRVSGYNLDELLPENGFNVARALVGTEGTCVTILEATLRLIDRPKKLALVVLGFDDIVDAGHAVAGVKQFKPSALEGLDDVLIGGMKRKDMRPSARSLLPEGAGWLMAEFGGQTREEANARARELMDHCTSEGIRAELFVDFDERHRLWRVRESGLGATANVPERPDAWEGWEDSACPPERLGDYLYDFRELLERYDFHAPLYGHFGQGCVHTRIPFNLRTAEGIETFRSFIDEASDLCLKYGGSFSAEHGDGQARGELLPKMFGEELCEAFRDFKAIWDPDLAMNPGKVVDPYRMDQNLRLGEGYRPPNPKTHFAFPDDEGSFGRAAERCVGIGKCRSLQLDEGDVMCPSYIATREEKHSTRGRARLLFEMLNGDVTPNTWDNPDVKDALDLCLSCKGCKNDCPVNVDMATYKAEFLAHYYESNSRPRAAYSMGLIHWWARLASLAPAVANFVAHAPGLSRLGKYMAGVAQDREMPRFARTTFRKWLRSRGSDADSSKPEVILWADTFNNYMRPETAMAAVAVLEDAGYRVRTPQHALCCGRPLYDFGWVERGKILWQDIMEVLGEDIGRGTPIVGIEPSCTAAFRDELINLFPHDDRARALKEQVFTLSEFLVYEAKYAPPPLDVHALFHGHCHQRSILGIEPDRELLTTMGVRFDMPRASCCGMAGAFGFETENYDVSLAVAGHELLPAVENTPLDDLIITNGFSCREQIEQLTGRKTTHLAEVIAEAIGRRDDAPPVRSRGRTKDRRPLRTAAVVGSAAVLGLACGLSRRTVRT
jgi:FAD/FMN-containing dehydrogenase/Fe-S oxidoreductase